MSLASIKVLRVLLIPIVFSLTFMTIAASPGPPQKDGNGETEIVELGPISLSAVLVKGGTFDMGDLWEAGKDNEKPVHKITLSDFYMSVTEVTIEQYKGFCLTTNRQMPLQEKGSRPKHPVVFLTWYDAQDFCKWAGGCLPTEAQWEYAARARGMPIEYPTGNEIDHDLANYSGKGKRDKWDKASPVAKFPPNPLGIYDLAGNVYEWCFDHYKSDYYSLSFTVDPIGPASGMYRVLRGGSWYHGESHLRTANRFRYLAVARISFVGFRVVWDANKVRPE